MASALVDDDGGVHSDPPVVEELHGSEGEDDGGRNQGHWWTLMFQSNGIREISEDTYKMPQSWS